MKQFTQNKYFTTRVF